MKNILIISAVFPPEQVTSALMTYDIARALTKKYKVTVLRPRPTRPIGVHYDNDDNLVGEPFETVTVDSYTCPESRLIGRMKESISFGRQCSRYIEAHKHDIDFVYNGSWQLFGVYIVAKKAVKNNIPYLITVQDIYPESLLTGHHYPKVVEWLVKSLFLPMDKYYTSHAVKVRTISDEMADYMSRTRQLPRSQYEVMNNWQNDEDFEMLPEKGSDKPFVFAYVGSINVHANVDLIIKAFNDAKLDDAELHIYGGGNRKDYCKSLAEELGSKRILFGQVSREEVPLIQAKADVAVLALPRGNGGICLPSKMTSYMLSGKPILASIDKGSTTERYILDAQCGIIVDPDNAEALSNGFRRFGKMDEKELRKMGENARRFAEDNLTRKANLPKVIKIIENVIN